MSAADQVVMTHSLAWDVPTEPLSIITPAALAATVTV